MPLVLKFMISSAFRPVALLRPALAFNSSVIYPVGADHTFSLTTLTAQHSRMAYLSARVRPLRAILM
jgi:hypothetical protein